MPSPASTAGGYYPQPPPGFEPPPGMFWPYQGPQPSCTSEREICLPANYSKFQLPNKGNVTIVSIGGLLICVATTRRSMNPACNSVWVGVLFPCQFTLLPNFLVSLEHDNKEHLMALDLKCWVFYPMLP